MAPSLTAYDRLSLAEKILKLFRIERFTYLGVSLVTTLVLILVGYQSLTQQYASKSAAGLMFGSAGVVTLSINRLLVMFNRVFKAVLGI